MMVWVMMRRNNIIITKAFLLRIFLFDKKLRKYKQSILNKKKREKKKNKTN